MGKSTPEIAKTLQIGASTVATLYNRARSKGYEVVIVIPGDILGLMHEEETDIESY
ncbi:MAG TPA: RNA polymerase subunit sigma-70, partial [Syntrophomonas sp.]|nr:RNA polymerase subunit sigma-70 [Syntrophomonas sp.]